MNTSNLRKHYDKLTVRERFAAVMAAAARGDEGEIDALNDSEQSRTYAIAHHQLLVTAFDVLALLYRCQQLEKATALLMVHQFDDEEGESVYPQLRRDCAQVAAGCGGLARGMHRVSD